MKVTTILGSPKKNGNTASVLNILEELLVAQGNQVTRIHVIDHDIKGCLGCGACQKATGAPGCIQNDDAPAILERLVASDVVVYASPLYGWNFTSQIKSLLDRHFCLATGRGPNRVSLLNGKRAALLITCAGPAKNADLVQAIFDQTIGRSRQVVGKYVLSSCTTPSALGERAAEIAQTMFSDITES
jgi:multimeric flavodoxin WrbA